MLFRSTGNNLRKIKFATSNIGWIIGETGTILKTTDGGNTWLNQYYFGNDDIIDLSVVDSNNLYLVTATNELYLSSDGGNKWYLKSFFWSGGCSAISFININEGWASIGNNIQHTTDGGINWSSQFNFPNEYISAIKMESNGKGIAVSTFGTLFHSSDYGQNWSVDANHTGNFNAMDVNTFYSTALAINNNTLYKSTDNGATWNDPVTTPAEFSLSTPTSIKIIYATVYLATTVDGQVLFTSDGGTTWNSNSDLLGNSLSDCIGLSPTKIIAVGNQGKIGWSNNAGSSLASLETRITNQELWGVHHNGNNLVAVGDGGSILLSNNSGQTWSLSNSGSTEIGRAHV